MRFLIIIPILIFWLIPLMGYGGQSKLAWQEWSRQVFAQAKQEDKWVWPDGGGKLSLTLRGL